MNQGGLFFCTLTYSQKTPEPQIDETGDVLPWRLTLRQTIRAIQQARQRPVVVITHKSVADLVGQVGDGDGNSICCL